MTESQLPDETIRLTVDALIEKAQRHAEEASKCYVAAAAMIADAAAIVKPHQPEYGRRCVEAAKYYLLGNRSNAAKILAYEGQFIHKNVGADKEDLETLRRIEKHIDLQSRTLQDRFPLLAKKLR